MLDEALAPSVSPRDAEWADEVLHAARWASTAGALSLVSNPKLTRMLIVPDQAMRRLDLIVRHTDEARQILAGWLQSWDELGETLERLGYPAAENWPYPTTLQMFELDLVCPMTRWIRDGSSKVCIQMSDEGALQLQQFDVEPEHRHSGLAQLILDTIIRFAKRHGLGAVVLYRARLGWSRWARERGFKEDRSSRAGRLTDFTLSLAARRTFR